MKLGKTVEIECRCLECHAILDLANSIHGDARPTPGDISICFYCGNLSAFMEDGNLRELTSNEMHDIAGDERLIAAMKNRKWIRDEIRKKQCS